MKLVGWLDWLSLFDEAAALSMLGGRRVVRLCRVQGLAHAWSGGSTAGPDHCSAADRSHPGSPTDSTSVNSRRNPSR